MLSKLPICNRGHTALLAVGLVVTGGEKLYFGLSKTLGYSAIEDVERRSVFVDIQDKLSCIKCTHSHCFGIEEGTHTCTTMYNVL